MQTDYFVVLLSLLEIQLPLLYNRPLSASVGRAVLSHKIGAKKSHTYWNDWERAGQVFSDHHDCTRIVELTAVVWGREECDQWPVVEKFITILHYLMRSAREEGAFQ